MDCREFFLDLRLGGERLLAFSSPTRDLGLVKSAFIFDARQFAIDRLRLPAFEQPVVRLDNRFADGEISQHQRDDSRDEREHQRPIGDGSRTDRNAGGLGTDAGCDADHIIRRQRHALTGDRDRQCAAERRQAGGNGGRQQHRRHQRHCRSRPEKQRDDIGDGGEDKVGRMAIFHDRAERFDHPDVRAQYL